MSRWSSPLRWMSSSRIRSPSKYPIESASRSSSSVPTLTAAAGVGRCQAWCSSGMEHSAPHASPTPSHPMPSRRMPFPLSWIPLLVLVSVPSIPLSLPQAVPSNLVSISPSFRNTMPLRLVILRPPCSRPPKPSRLSWMWRTALTRVAISTHVGCWASQGQKTLAI